MVRNRNDSSRNARHQQRESARVQRQAEKQLQKQQSPANLPNKFTLEYGEAVLANCGPQFFCSWGIPAATADALRKAGRAVLPPLQGALLLDTGATRTCIALQAATQLGLQATRMQDGIGAGGKYSNPVFLARLEIRIVHPKTGIVHPYAWEQEVEGIPELHNFAAPLVWQNQTMQVSGLLGRDILRHARIYYDGPLGRLRFEFDLASLQGKPSR